jgi:uncharacterized membrane protein
MSRLSAAVLGRRLRAEERRLRLAGVHPDRAALLAAYACRDGMSPNERNQRRARRAYREDRARAWRERRVAGST